MAVLDDLEETVDAPLLMDDAGRVLIPLRRKEQKDTFNQFHLSISWTLIPLRIEQKDIHSINLVCQRVML